MITSEKFNSSFFIPGNVPSLKNSRQGKFMSKTCRNYLRSFGIQNMSARTGITEYKTRPNTFPGHIPDDFKGINCQDFPIWVGFYFIRSSLERFDFHNAVQILADLFVTHGMLPDDNCNYFLPVPVSLNGSCWHKDPWTAGVWVYYNAQ